MIRDIVYKSAKVTGILYHALLKIAIVFPAIKVKEKKEKQKLPIVRQTIL
jgi:hypothetical protein